MVIVATVSFWDFAIDFVVFVTQCLSISKGPLRLFVFPANFELFLQILINFFLYSEFEFIMGILDFFELFRIIFLIFMVIIMQNRNEISQIFNTVDIDFVAVPVVQYWHFVSQIWIVVTAMLKKVSYG